MQRSQRKRCAPSWLKEKPYIKVRFTQDGMITKVLESWKIKLSEGGKHLAGSLANFSFRVDQKVWCYWKTVDEREKCYFEGKIIEIWDDSGVTAEIEADEDQTIPITNDFEALEDVEAANGEVSPKKKKQKRTKEMKKTAKPQVANYVDEEVKAAKQLENKKKREEEKAKHEDNLQQSKELLKVSDESMDMLFDFMNQITSRLERIEEKVDRESQNLQRLLKKIEKRKEHSLPVQVFVNKSGENNEKPASPVLPQTSSPPVLCSTPKTGLQRATSTSKKFTASSQDEENEIFTCDDETENSASVLSELSTVTAVEDNSPEKDNNTETAIIGDPKFGIKLDRECFDNIVKHSSSAPAFALNLLDALIPKEVQRISNIKGSNGKTPLNTSILAAIKGQLRRQYKWTEEEVEEKWSGKAGIQQKIADKCRNLNKSNKI